MKKPRQKTRESCAANFFRMLSEEPTEATSCWEWQGPIDPNGYGRFYRGKSIISTMLAHRWHWIYIHGLIAPKIQLDHLCRNRRCVRLNHLRTCSNWENMLAGLNKIAANARKTVGDCGHPLVACKKTGLRRCKLCLAIRSKEKKREIRAQKRQAKIDAGLPVRNPAREFVRASKSLMSVYGQWLPEESRPLPKLKRTAAQRARATELARINRAQAKLDGIKRPPRTPEQKERAKLNQRRYRAAKKTAAAKY